MNQFQIEKIRASYDVESRVEGFHWWFAVRRKLLGSILSSIQFPERIITLEVGCGTGSNLRLLTAAGFYVIGLDQSEYALTLVKSKEKFPLLAGDLNNLPIKTKSIGLIIAMDVLEHLEYDGNGMSECYRVLSNGGVFFLTVPAFKSLWGIQDNVTGHKRRYSMKEIKNKLKQEGFVILKSSFFNFLLFFPILIARRIIDLLELQFESENKINHPLVNYFLKTIFSIEPYFLQFISFPFGVSIFCVAKKG